MIGEIDIYGVFFPSILVWVAIAFGVISLFHRATRRFSIRPFVWHLPLFNVATFTIVLGAVVALTSLWMPQ
ncbi:DUF1656 domain-containing protein [Telmatospirillum sp.]|uniref:DUF1656 domain-containing protein n=1 Tax=Telmatospirillum sp. TaxID=2079197 RepID=UPI002849118E|nr:DUF1656 domain-containing protein [Telmatospirillum sp.]MDR3436530.1 DUF1656 domain-containing protein [Telmatospirillum sp.]